MISNTEYQLSIFSIGYESARSKLGQPVRELAQAYPFPGVNSPLPKSQVSLNKGDIVQSEGSITRADFALPAPYGVNFLDAVHLVAIILRTMRNSLHTPVLAGLQVLYIRHFEHLPFGI
jgi:hypothetical protein